MVSLSSGLVLQNVFCQEFSTIGPAWYTHLFKMRPVEGDDTTYLGDIFYDDKYVDRPTYLQ